MRQIVRVALIGAHSSHRNRCIGYRKNVFPTSTSRLTSEQRQSRSLLGAFFLAAALYPHVVKKAQEELDRVVGSERLPQLSDQVDLPYISALLKELLRWFCPVPFGIPKRVTEDDVYRGYFIPAGTTIIENIW